MIQNLLTQFFASNFQYFGTAPFEPSDAPSSRSRPRQDAGSRSFTIKTVAFGLGRSVASTWNFLTYKYWAFRQDEVENTLESP